VVALTRLDDALHPLEGQTSRPSRGVVLRYLTQALERVVRRSILTSLDRELVEARATRLLESLKATETSVRPSPARG